MPNHKGVLECRYVTLKPAADNIWTKGIERIICPVSHGEGNFSCSKETLAKLQSKKMIAFTYCKEDMKAANGEYPFNPNGSTADIAGITSENGKVLAMMPHPERAMEFVNLYDWTLQKEKMKRQGLNVPTESLNMQLFRNIVNYFN